jgi:hypothetical protein
MVESKYRFYTKKVKRTNFSMGLPDDEACWKLATPPLPLMGGKMLRLLYNAYKPFTASH